MAAVAHLRKAELVTKKLACLLERKPMISNKAAHQVSDPAADATNPWSSSSHLNEGPWCSRAGSADAAASPAAVLSAALPSRRPWLVLHTRWLASPSSLVPKLNSGRRPNWTVLACGLRT